MIFDQNTMLILTIIALAILIIQLYMEYRRKPKQAKYIPKELVKCRKCGYEIERDYEPGDFISLVKGKCPKCGGELIVKAIYSVKLEERKA